MDKRLIFGAALVLVASGVAWAGRREEPARWPDAAIVLAGPTLKAPSDFGRRRIYLDAGHGAPDNPGNRSALCEWEQDFTLALAAEVGRRLEESSHFEVRISRPKDALVPYQARVQEADAWGAEAFISLHSDVRGRAESERGGGGQCVSSHAAPGFTVLWSDEGQAARTMARRSLAHAISEQMQRAGLSPYGGAEYRDLYEAEPNARGVFIDRHALDQRIYVLRSPKAPSVIIETHNARDEREALRWREPATWDAFTGALAAALLETLDPGT